MKKIICLCGNTLNIQDEPVTCACGRRIHPNSLSAANIRLTPYEDTSHHDRDIFGETKDGVSIRPVFFGYTMHREYESGRWDDCDSWIEAVNLSDPKDRVTSFNWEFLKQKILENRKE